MGKIIAAGHICLDITPVFPESARGQTPETLLQPGKLLHMAGADVHTGGSVANTGLALKMLGNEVTLLGKIGKDAIGGMVKSIVAYLTAVLRGYDPARCAALAAAEGACCVTAYDALSGLKPIDELNERIQSGWKTME